MHDTRQRVICPSVGPARQMTFEEWLAGHRTPLPSGFRETGFAYQQWDRSNTIGLALRNWAHLKPRDLKRLERARQGLTPKQQKRQLRH